MPLVRLVGWLVLANAVPALVSLLLFPRATDRGFAWTLAPLETVRLLTGLYATAVAIGVLGIRARRDDEAFGIALLATVFSIGATAVSLVHRSLLLAHPWWHAAQWFGVYGVLIPTGVVAVVRLRPSAGAVALERSPSGATARGVVMVTAGILLGLGALLVAAPRSSAVGGLWPWPLPPLSARLTGVWAASLGVGLFAATFLRPAATLRRTLFGLVAVLGATLLVSPLLGDGPRSIGALAATSPVYLGIAVGLVLLGGTGTRSPRPPGERL